MIANKEQISINNPQDEPIKKRGVERRKLKLPKKLKWKKINLNKEEEENLNLK